MFGIPVEQFTNEPRVSYDGYGIAVPAWSKMDGQAMSGRWRDGRAKLRDTE